MMESGLMEGMLWASLLMVGVPLLIGIGVAVVLLRRRADRRDGARAEPG